MVLTSGISGHVPCIVIFLYLHNVFRALILEVMKVGASGDYVYEPLWELVPIPSCDYLA